MSNSMVKSSKRFLRNDNGCDSLELMLSKTIGLETNPDVSPNWSITYMKYLLR